MNVDPTHFFAMHAIDDTIIRSRQAVEDSLSLAKRNSERKLVLEQRLRAFMKQQDSRRKESEISELHSFYVDGRVRDPDNRTETDEGRKPSSQIHADIKEKAIQREASPPRDYLSEIDSLRSELAHEREWRSHFCEIERVLTQRISEQDSRIAELETKLREAASPRQPAGLSPQHFGELASDQYLSTLHRELSPQRHAEDAGDHLRNRKATYELEDSLASLRERSRKIEELEEKLKSSREKYEEMKRKVTSPRRIKRSGDLQQSATSRSPLETQSFDNYLSRSSSLKRSSPTLQRPTSGVTNPSHY